MTLRRKFLIALIGLVFFMAAVFYGIALTSVNNLLGHAVTYVQQGFRQQWTRMLTSYYQEHGSWNGIQDYVIKVMDNAARNDISAPHENERFYVFDSDQKIIASPRARDLGKGLGQLPLEDKIPQSWTALKLNDQTIGYFWVDDKARFRQNRLAKSIGESIVRSMVIGLILTALLALGFGTLFTSRFTGPLKDLLQAVRRVGEGDLKARLEVKGNDDIALLGQAFNQMTERLARIEEVRKNMVADIAHELRTPLAVISGKLESIQEGILPLSAETLLPIQDETIRLIRLVQDLQQLSLAEAGKLPLKRTPVNIRQLLERIFGHFAIEFEERGIQGELESEDWIIHADSDRLTQVFVNLIGNALLHTAAGGKIFVKVDSWGQKVAREEEKRFIRKSRLASGGESESSEKVKERTLQWIRVQVEDTGEGIPPEELEHIFDRFYRVDRSRVRETGGTGLGLAIAKEFVQAHGGEIEVKSVLGSGTCFSVFLPINNPTTD